jgi:hypothetical protein
LVLCAWVEELDLDTTTRRLPRSSSICHIPQSSFPKKISGRRIWIHLLPGRQSAVELPNRDRGYSRLED